MFSSIYRVLCHTGDKILYPRLPSFAQSIWNHEAGPKTIFFWAPTMKWCLVLAGIADLKRPADKLSIYQNIALFMTGLIWTRYSFVIRPINYNLASVNIFVCTIGLYQMSQKQLLSGLTQSQSAD